MRDADSSLVLSLVERDDLRTLVQNVGEGKVRDLAVISRETFARALAGLPVRRGTLALIRAALIQALPSAETAE